MSLVRSGDFLRNGSNELTDNLTVAPWGRFWKLSEDLISASKTKSLGGTGTADQFWKWSEAQVKLYA